MSFKFLKSLFIIFTFISVIEAESFDSKEKLVGNILKNTLETYHYKKLTIDDSVSQKAFAEYVKKIDYGKQFLFQKDIKTLEKYQFLLDDYMNSSEPKVIKDSMKLVNAGVKRADSFRKEFFKKGFDFSKDESLQLDPDKRSFPKNLKEQKELWRKLLSKQLSLGIYISLMKTKS